MIASNIENSSGFTCLLKIHCLHFSLSGHDKQIFDGSIMVGNNLTIMSTAAGMDLPIAHEKRLTEIDAISENCGEYIRLFSLIPIGTPPNNDKICS